jgi:hypothetical protein
MSDNANLDMFSQSGGLAHGKGAAESRSNLLLGAGLYLLMR